MTRARAAGQRQWPQGVGGTRDSKLLQGLPDLVLKGFALEPKQENRCVLKNKQHATVVPFQFFRKPFLKTSRQRRKGSAPARSWFRVKRRPRALHKSRKSFTGESPASRPMYRGITCMVSGRPAARPTAPRATTRAARHATPGVRCTRMQLHEGAAERKTAARA